MQGGDLRPRWKKVESKGCLKFKERVFKLETCVTRRFGLAGSTKIHLTSLPLIEATKAPGLQLKVDRSPSSTLESEQRIVMFNCLAPCRSPFAPSFLNTHLSGSKVAVAL